MAAGPNNVINAGKAPSQQQLAAAQAKHAAKQAAQSGQAPVGTPAAKPAPQTIVVTRIPDPADDVTPAPAKLPPPQSPYPKRRTLGQPDPSQQFVAQPRPVKVGPAPGVITMLLFALIIVNGFTAGHFKKLFGTISGASTTPTHSEFLILGGELVFVVALSMIAESSEGARGPILALVFGLWLLWGVSHGTTIRNFISATTPVAPPTKPQPSNIPGVPGPYTP